MIIRSVLFVLLLACINPVFSQSQDTAFKKQWVEIDTLIIQKDLTRTAIAKVKKLYTAAKKRQNYPHLIRCLVYQNTLEDRISSNDPGRMIKTFRDELASIKDETGKAILHSLLAKQYKQYYYSHRWNLSNRKNTEGNSKNDIATWSEGDFTKAIRMHYMASINNAPLLQKQDISAWQTLLINGDAKQSLRPTLYDLLVHEAIEYFSTADNINSAVTNPFILDDKKAYAPASSFININFKTADTSSAKRITTALFQKLISFHLADTDKDAFVKIDIERIEWVHQNSVIENKDYLYISFLNNITRQYPTIPSAIRAWYLLAHIEVNKAGGYQPFGDTTNRFGYIKAEQLIGHALSQFKSIEADSADLIRLRNSFHRKELNIQVEKVNIPGKPFRSLISFRNIDTLYARIIKIDNTPTGLKQGRHEPDFWKKAGEIAAYTSFIQVLPINTDYQRHSTEIKIDALPVGEYALLTSSGNGFNGETDKMTVQNFQVSNISFVKKENDLFVLHRESGNPFDGAKVVVTYRTDGKEKKYNLVTDKNGFTHIPIKESSGRLDYSFMVKDDRLHTDESYYYYRSSSEDDNDDEMDDEEYEEENARVYFFTDRYIYRPGQTVYFKGIAVTKDRKTKLSKTFTRKIDEWVFLQNTSNKHIDSIKIVLNDYGSFTGSFRLPINELTGEFSIETDFFDEGSTSFSVEEYKRPKFEAAFEKVKGSYRLHDSITVKGNVKAFAGNNVSGAEVKYTVVRKPRYMPWKRGIAMPRANREIANGTISTKPDGSFTITFKAAADDIPVQVNELSFDFEVEADVTDINGETHSATTNIEIGFSALKLQVTAPRLEQADSLRYIRIATTNYSHEKEAAVVRVSISPLLPQQRLIRKRYWQRPDQFVLSEKEFIALFPTDEYNNETDITTWKAGTPLIESILNTADSNLFAIPANRLNAGYYKVETVAKDKYGVEVKQETNIQLFNIRDGKLPLPAYQFYYNINNQIEPGQQAAFLTGTDAANIFVIRQVSRPGQKKDIYTYEHRNNGLKKHLFTAEESDRGNSTITEAYVIDNRVYTTSQQVIVHWTNKVLQVGYASYRNKTEPGSKETWSMTVSGYHGEKVAAELLTTMYDASLDAFKKHNWQVPPLWDIQGRYNNSFDYDENFGTIYSNENYLGEYYVPIHGQTFLRLPNNGQEIWNQRIAIWRKDSTISESYDKLYSAFEKRAGGVALQSLASTRNATNIQIRGAKSASNAASPIYVVDGNIVTDISSIDPSMISSLTILKGDQATALYGAGAANGAIIVNTNGAAALPTQEPVQIRKNFNETAFFFPQLYADSSGKFSFSFTMPEALTKWKWMALAHTKELAFGDNSTTIITQKKMMVQPNAPRFMREGDNMELSTKIVNLTDKEIKGQATLELIDPITNTSVDGWFNNVFPVQYFTAEAGQSMAIKFPVQIPFSYNKALIWRIIARSENISDGEENTLPILTNRMLVTETLPLFLAKDTTRSFVFDKLLNNTSESLTHESITVEYTSNPVWYAVQALPYLVEYPYECAEQTFNRFYANTLASYIINKHPRIKQVFEQWKKDTTALLSNLQKNEELKQILLQETPWVLQAGSEEQKKRNLALLFDLARLNQQSDMFIKKLEDMQMPDGAFSWFKGGYADRYITNYILTGIGKLKRLGALTPDLAVRIKNILIKAIQYMDARIADDYNQLIKNKAGLFKQNIYSGQLDYLFMRSFFGDIAQQSRQAHDYYFKQAKTFWTKQTSYQKAQIGLIYLRNNEQAFVSGKILPALLENVVEDEKMGMYWKSAYTGFWYQSPIEHQAMMIAFVSELQQNNKDAALLKHINAMKTWLLLNKQTNNWRTTIATADACYALLLNGNDWLAAEKTVTIRLGNTVTVSNNGSTEAGTGYLKKRIDGKQANNQMGNISVSVHAKLQTPNSKLEAPSWGSVYWQYFEDLDKITASASPLSLVKKLFIEKNTDKGKTLQAINENDELKIGDKIIVRIELRSDRDMDYLHLKDMRAASMEPVNVLSGYKWQDGLGYYESTRDASTNFFIDHLRKGTYVFEYPLFITHAGAYSVGITSIQCMYAPEFTSHSEGMKIRVAN